MYMSFSVYQHCPFLIYLTSTPILPQLSSSLIAQTQHSQTATVVETEDPAAATMTDLTTATANPTSLGCF